MNCPKCGSENINTQIVQTEGKTKKHAEMQAAKKALEDISK